MKKVLFTMATLGILLLTSCTKDKEADYNRRDKNAGGLQEHWKLTSYVGQLDHPEGITADKFDALQDDVWTFDEPSRDYNAIAYGKLTMDQGEKLFWPDRPRVIVARWRMDPDFINSVYIEVLDAEGKVIGSNRATVDVANWKMRFYSNFRYVNKNGALVQEPFTSLYEFQALPR